MSPRRSLDLIPFVLFTLPCAGQTTHLLSVDSSGALANGRSDQAAISGDGSCVAFMSLANNLVPGDTNGFSADIFVRELDIGSTTRVSVRTNGNQANGSSANPSISQTGRFVAFGSMASNLVPGDQNGTGDVFLHDRALGTTERVSTSSSGNEGDAGSGGPTISADGNRISFLSLATNLVAGDTNLVQDIFLHDRAAGTTIRVSVDTFGVETNEACYEPTLSGDGGTVAYFSSADNLTPGDTNAVADIFVHDVASGTTTRVSVDSAGAQANSGSWSPSLSHDGRFVAFHSFASNLVPGDTNIVSDVFVHDRVTSETRRVSVDSLGRQVSGYSEDACISADGRHVAFVSLAPNLVVGDGNGQWDVFVHDRLLGLTERCSLDSSDAEADDYSLEVSLSSSGREVAFLCWSDDLDSADTNGFRDVYLRRRAIAGGGVVGAGDGSGAACPCGNAGAAGEGCANSSGKGGRIARYGSSRLGSGEFRMVAEQLPPGSVAMLFVGGVGLAGGQGLSFGDGLRVAGVGVVRLGTRVVDGSGAAVWDPIPRSAGGWSAGQSRFFQVWYQDSSGSPCGSGFNTTPAHPIVFAP